MKELKFTDRTGWPEGPQLLMFPPLIPLVTVVLAAILHWACPMDLFSSVPIAVRTSVGAAVCAAGFALLLGGILALRSHRTGIHPSHPTRTLVTGGAFRLTRNPLYVGGSLILLSGSLIPSLGWLAILSAPCLLALHFGIVLPEEAYLERKFGESYRQYKVQVPRYFVVIGPETRDL